MKVTDEICFGDIIYIGHFMMIDDWFRHSSNIKGITAII
jgi:hypothetical protein